MKVFQINTVGGQSTGRLAADLARTLISCGHDSILAYTRGTAASDIPSLRFGSMAQVYAHIAMTRLTDRAGFFSKKATAQLIGNIREYAPDIIHLHNIHGYVLNIEMLFSFLREYDRPVVWTMHDCWPFTGHCYGFEDVGCDKWLTGCHDCQLRRTYPASLFFDRSRDNYNDKKRIFTSLDRMVMVTPSQWLAGLFRRSFLRRYPVELIHNGINSYIFRPTESDFREKYAIGERRMVLGVASPWNDRKGLSDFYELRRRLDDFYAIVLVGLTERQMRDLPGGIIGITRTDSAKQLAQIYTAADLFVNPTYQDNFPTVNIEALSCGTPVVTYDVGGSAEVADETCGRAVPCGDIDALLREIESFSAPQDACLARAARYGIRECCEKYMEIYKSLIGA